MIDTLSTLTSNILFYSSSTYKEFFLTTAQLPETIFNLSAFLGYNSTEATYATVNALITVPLTFTEPSVTATIPSGFNFSAGTVKFITDFDTTIVITNNSSVLITAIQNSAKTYNLPVIIDTTSAEPSFSFLLPIAQYTKVTQEFQIDEDTPLYQFVTIDVPLNGKVSSMDVSITDPGSNTSRTYTEFSSVYLMSSTDYGYVSRTTVNGRRLVFGNSLIGVQPLPGSTVNVVTYITEGLDGNVIPASITTGDRIYTSDGKIVNYTVTNTSPATGGADEESLQEIRSNAIINLVALNRLVSEYDYQNAGSIIPDSPIAESSIPVLKRSDVKCNEIQLFSVIQYGSESHVSETTGQTVTTNSIAPTRNAFYTIPISQVYIPRGTIITLDSVNYYTLFDIEVDLINLSASYTYILYEIDIVPSLTTSYGIVYDFVCSNLNVLKTGNAVTFTLSYASTEVDYDLCNAVMVVNSSLLYSMTNNPLTKTFTYTFDPYTNFPDSNQVLEFNIYNSSDVMISTWAAEVTFRKNLNNFMMSNISTDGTSTTIYDIPVIQQSYYDDPDFSQKDFELTVLQTMMNQMNFNTYKMLTDFTNLKFTNTVGTMINMKYNLVTKNSCIDIGRTSPPSLPNVGDRYIIGYTETGEWANKNNLVAQCIDATNVTWYYFTPITDDIIYVLTTDKKYIYNGYKWIPMEYQIPLLIEVEIFKTSNYYGTDIALVNLVKDTLLEKYSSSFGPNITLYKSDIISTIQGITGVSHCNLIKPESNLFFKYTLEDLTEQELLEYSPEYVFFTEDSISVKVYT